MIVLDRSRRASRAIMAVALSLVVAGQAAAQEEPPPCEAPKLLAFGKAAFFRSIERGAFAIGERTLEDLADGLGTGSGSAARKASARHARGITPAQARATVFPATVDDAITTALKGYAESPSSEGADEAFGVLLASATKVLFETPPGKAGEAGRVGLLLENGQFFNRNSSFAVSDMVEGGRRQKLEDSLFGAGPDLMLGAKDKLLGAEPFFKAPIIADTRNVDRNNIGLEVTTEQEMRSLWFDDYKAHLAKAVPAATPAQITDALNAGWPTVQKFWAFKRTEIFVDRAQTAFGLELRPVRC
jgi:hypothetical protein